MLTLQIREETGIETEFRSIVAFRHGHNFNFGCSDIYIVVALKPLSEAIHTDQKEIAKCQWMPLQVRSSFIYCTVSKRVLILRTLSLIRTFLAFWVLNGSLFIFQGPYFHFFGFIHAKNVNSVCMYTTMSYFDLCVTSNYLHCYYTCML